MKTITNFFKNNYKIIITIVAIIISISFLGFFFKKIDLKNPSTSKVWENINYVKISDVKVKVELALTPEAQEKGLSGRDKMGENEGMLFVFGKTSKYYFWMKDMEFPIDIIWIGKDMKVVYIEKNVKTDTYPQTFGPNKDAMYILEVNALFSEKNNLKENDNVIFLP